MQRMNLFVHYHCGPHPALVTSDVSDLQGDLSAASLTAPFYAPLAEIDKASQLLVVFA